MKSGKVCSDVFNLCFDVNVCLVCNGCVCVCVCVWSMNVKVFTLLLVTCMSCKYQIMIMLTKTKFNLQRCHISGNFRISGNFQKEGSFYILYIYIYFFLITI